MKRVSRRIGIGVVSLAVALAAPRAARLGAAARDGDRAGELTVITGATLIDGTGRPPVPDAAIVIDGDRIAAAGQRRAVAIPRGARELDMRGKFVVPGLIDAHCHLEAPGLGDAAELPQEWRQPEKLRQLVEIDARLDLLGGVTTIRDLGSTDVVLRVRDAINAGTFTGPRVLAAGRQLVKKASGAYMDSTFLEFDGAEDAREKVRQQVAAGVDWIKLRLTSQRPLPSPEEVRAIVNEAHRLGRRVTTHTDVPADRAVQLAVEAGVDGIEHNAPLRAESPDVLRTMGRRHVAMVSGIGGYYVQRLAPLDPQHAVDAAGAQLLPQIVVARLREAAESLLAQRSRMPGRWDRAYQLRAALERARKAGVLLGFGTDCGGELLIHGQQYKALYGETQLGSSPMQALLMATRDAARVIGRDRELGTLEAGKLADLVIVGADPLADIRNLSQVIAVVKGGVLYRPAELLNAPSTGH